MKSTETSSFREFLLKNRENRRYLIIAAVTVMLQFVVFKFLFPFANYMPDSYSYIEAAWRNADINLWPIGYSKFLRAFSAFSRWDTALVFIQYLMLQAAIIYFIFTLIFFLKPGKIARYILLLFFLINPILLYISNYISADALFTSLSLVWLVQLIWILLRPRTHYIWLHALVLLVAFMVRYNALYYPFISVVVFLVSAFPWRKKLAGIGLTLLLVGAFMWHTASKYKEQYGIWQLSTFGGWQLASNALFMYSHVKNDQQKPPARFTALHRIVQKHMDSLQHLEKRPDTALGIYYLWNSKAPLKQYMAAKWKKDTLASDQKKWASVAPLYAAYGKYLILRHPVAFAKYYIWPNTVNYYVPPVEFLSMYNMKSDSVQQMAKTWFGYKSLRVKGFSKETSILKYYPVVLSVINLGFFCGIIGFFLLKGFKKADRQFLRALFLLVAIWLSNLAFSVLASPIVLRYQLFPMVFTLAFAVLLIEFIYYSDSKPEVETLQFDEIPDKAISVE